MSAQSAALDFQTLRRFIRAVADLLTSEVRGKAIFLLCLLLAFALAVNGLNVVSRYVGRDFMTAIADQNMARFVRLAILYIGFFAAMTAVAVFYRFTEERLGLLWRSWLTRRVTARYLESRTYLRLKESAEIDNPDQRIAEDTRAFTTTTLSFSLIFLNSTLAGISFSGVLCTISPLLFCVALGYAALGTLMTVLLGRPLVWLNYRQSDQEANFRASLIHVRENAESVALLHCEDQLRARLLDRIDGLVGNFRRKDQDRLAYERLTLRRLKDDGPLVADVSLSIPRGTRVLVTGPNEAARVALFRATAGIWSQGEGRIIRPPLDAVFFLPQQPYLAPGTLRHLLIGTGEEQGVSDERILEALHDGGLDSVVERAGGIDAERDWPAFLKLGEQQQLVIIRLILARPSFALLDRVSTALGPALLQRALQQLTASSITYINFDQAADSEPVEFYDAVLEINADGVWCWRELRRVYPRQAFP